MEERTMDKFLSSIVEFIDMIEFTSMMGQEKLQLETNNTDVLSIYNELWEIWSLLEYADEGADEEDPARGKYLKLEKAIHEAAVTIVDNVFRTAHRGGRKPLFERCSYCKDFGSPKESGVKIISSISESIKEFKGQLKGSSSYYSRQESFNLLDLIRSSVDFDEAEEDLTTVVGLKQDMESLKAQLRGDSHFRVISVLGIKGIGKTTLVRKIYKSRFVEVNFQSKAWVCVSGIDHDSSEIWEDIHTKIQKFSPDKMYPCLIVIDGLHDFQFWSQLQSSLQGALGNRIFESGSRIILTTRDVNIASPADYTHRSKVLSKEESWKLFKTVFRAPWKLSNASGEDTKESPIPLPQELDALGQEMVGKCGGIPYIIRELANLLSTVNADHVEWSCVLHGTDTHLSSDQHPWFNLSSFVDHILPLHVKPFLHFFPIETEFSLEEVH
ncbi:hypothetical protein NE237_023336 [Protea cynaroides]|uniref:NB-ARC domain-containing protein n=1 Tax=Protea cynaroides TaxID=273540 RepID=A0A9Q0HBJ4_9MAGN|nr:hypothetical protein NE237_023336 [Protea cynaroides]